ncbi:hypothetical protein [Amycolatopsis orientalis]|uniref:hypothetical protein n=1 Tax=Amycolatopsis orientalis TaxID=31958 RepID=UPI001428D826
MVAAHLTRAEVEFHHLAPFPRVGKVYSELRHRRLGVEFDAASLKGGQHHPPLPLVESAAKGREPITDNGRSLSNTMLLSNFPASAASSRQERVKAPFPRLSRGKGAFTRSRCDWWCH